MGVPAVTTGRMVIERMARLQLGTGNILMRSWSSPSYTMTLVPQQAPTGWLLADIPAAAVAIYPGGCTIPVQAIPIASPARLTV